MVSEYLHSVVWGRGWPREVCCSLWSGGYVNGPVLKEPLPVPGMNNVTTA